MAARAGTWPTPMSDWNVSKDASRHGTGGRSALPQERPGSQMLSRLTSRIRGTQKLFWPLLFVSNVISRISPMSTVRVRQPRMATLPALTRTPVRAIPDQRSAIGTMMIAMTPTLPSTPMCGPAGDATTAEMMTPTSPKQATTTLVALRSWAKV